MSDTPNNGHCQQNLRRVVISSLIGAVIEWYDFFPVRCRGRPRLQ